MCKRNLNTSTHLQINLIKYYLHVCVLKFRSSHSTNMHVFASKFVPKLQNIYTNIITDHSITGHSSYKNSNKIRIANTWITCPYKTVLPNWRFCSVALSSFSASDPDYIIKDTKWAIIIFGGTFYCSVQTTLPQYQK